MDSFKDSNAAVTAPARRRWLTGAVAVGAAAAGAGWAAWRYRVGDVADEAVDAIWHKEFATLSGGAPLKMQSLMGKPLLLNFWATWCAPCVEELPMLNTFYQAQLSKGWTVLGLAVDKESNVLPFLQRMPLSFPIALAGADGTALSRELGNSVGGLPFTVLFDRHGRVQHRKMGQLLAFDLQNWASL